MACRSRQFARHPWQNRVSCHRRRAAFSCVVLHTDSQSPPAIALTWPSLAWADGQAKRMQRRGRHWSTAGLPGLPRHAYNRPDTPCARYQSEAGALSRPITSRPYLMTVDLAFLTIAEASALIKARQLSPVEYIEALITRTETFDPQLHAYITSTF